MFVIGSIVHSLLLFGVAVLIVILVLLFRKGGETAEPVATLHPQPNRDGTRVLFIQNARDCQDHASIGLLIRKTE